jgi:2-hydroxychromene-2-carboxylate isomerase
MHAPSVEQRLAQTRAAGTIRPMVTPCLEFWFDFASTYSYPAAMRIGALADKAAVRVKFRPFLLGPIFKAQGWDTSPFNLFPAKGRHMWRDLERICADLALPFRRPEPFPQSSVLAARVALVGLDNGWGEDFCRAVYRAEFAEGRRIDEPQTMRAILAALRLDPDDVVAAAQTNEIKDKLRAETAEAQRLDIFGAPSFRTADGELFWGNDRLESALAAAKRAP